MADCPRRMRFFPRCKFEPRYDKSPVNLSQFKSIEGGTADVWETMRSITYVCDVCVRCGMIVKRG